MHADSSPPSASPPRHRLRAFLKWTLFAAVLWFVGWRAYELWEADKAALQDVRFGAGWLLLAAVAYVIGWLPSVWFWRALMVRMGGRLGLLDTARAYYCGHLGKYVPGKATVIVIRAALLRDRGLRAAPIAFTVVCETLTMIGTGVLVAVALAPYWLDRAAAAASWPAGARWLLETPWRPAAAVFALTAVSLPVMSLVFTRMAVAMTPRDQRGGDGEIRSALPLSPSLPGPARQVAGLPHETVRIDPVLLGAGMLAFVAAWALHGLSLGLTLRALSEQPLDLAEWPAWTGAASLATVAGFVAIFAPGGIGVREGILIETLRLQPGIAPPQAIAAAVFLRVVWFAAEILMAVALYSMIRGNTIRSSEEGRKA